jgi:hypothetical protein
MFDSRKRSDYLVAFMKLNSNIIHTFFRSNVSLACWQNRGSFVQYPILTVEEFMLLKLHMMRRTERWHDVTKF